MILVVQTLLNDNPEDEPLSSLSNFCYKVIKVKWRQILEIAKFIRFESSGGHLTSQSNDIYVSVKKKLKSGQFWPCYSQKCKNRKLLRRMTNFFQIFTKLWKFLSYSLFDYRKIVKSWLFGRAIQKPEVHLFNFFLLMNYC